MLQLVKILRRLGAAFFLLSGAAIMPPLAGGSSPSDAPVKSVADSAAVRHPSSRPIGPGVVHHRRVDPAGPWVINVIEIDRRNPYLRFETTKAGARLRAVEKTSALAAAYAASHAGSIVAAINGDFFDGTGMPVNAQVQRGELLRGPASQSVFAITAAGKPIIERLTASFSLRTKDGAWRTVHGINRPRLSDEAILYTPRFGAATATNDFGSEAQLQWLAAFMVNDTVRAVVRRKQSHLGNSPLALGSPSAILSAHGAAQRWLDEQVGIGDTLLLGCALRPSANSLATEKIVEAIGGLPRLVRDGKVSVETEEEGGKNFVNVRHPRTAVGFSADSSKIFLVTVDGRQAASVGMTLYELAELMISLGCSQALNLDGGGSTTMVVRGKVVNQPSDAAGERPVSNALLLFSLAPKSSLTQLAIEPRLAVCPVGETIDFSAVASDSFFNPIALDDKFYFWRLSRKTGLGAIDGKGRFTAQSVKEDSGYVMVSRKPGLRDSAKVITTTWRELKVEPDSLVLSVGTSRALQASLVDSRGRVYKKLPGQFEWEVEGIAGRISSAGVFTATAKGRGYVRVRFRNVEKKIAVVVQKPL